MTAMTSVALCALMAGGCVGGAYVVHVRNADSALQTAEVAGAMERAPYHYYAAQAYLAQARVDAGRSAFGAADALLRAARSHARRALERGVTDGSAGPSSSRTR